MKLAANRKYKESHVEWLGEVPQHWEVHKITRGFTIIASGTTPKSDSPDYYDGDVPWVTTSELRETVIRQTKQSLTRQALRDYPTLRMYPTGTILFAMYGATIGRLGILGMAATVNQACCAFSSPTKFDSRFIYYWLWMRRPILISLSSGGGQPNLSQDDLRQLRVPVPEVDEQQAIADFLDRKTARLDTLVGKKRELIEKLKEKRTALISRTVTRGLNPNVKLKSSGIEWLGDIPEHWEAKRLKHAAAVTTGFAFSSDDFTTDGVPVLRIGDIDQEGRVVFSDAKFLPVEYLRRHSNVVVQRNDIVTAMTGATIGKVGRYLDDSPALLNQRVCIFRALPNAEQSFVWYLLNAEFYIEHVILTAFGGAQPNISDTELLACPIPVPKKAEQRAIADYLDRETVKIDKMMEKVEAAIEKLQEYRTALITASVTGKIDVRAVDR